jgi:hypothetical protein
MSSNVICPKCSAVFRSRSVSAWLQTTEMERNTCPMCWAPGSFRAATEAEVATQQEARRSSTKQIVVFELIVVVLIFVAFAVGR